ncbi:MAG TPA: rRNA maturation RNase YbeY [Kiritimatiellia bacterium]|nr:rRNA maturation RNase YbeY [Kiritimatiellia bacterium]HMO98877.1 rRNA maturation RNase YbeY [Kiritimatiellia bacterium]HMP97631.1 rRNA maturation RNase YbeY [Kiritimatiellia bacterium]
MKILLTRDLRGRKISIPAWRRLIAWLMTKASAMNPGRAWVECSVVLVGHQRMTALNEHVLEHEGTTDVITFSYPTEPGESPAGWRAEIVINVEEAEEVAGPDPRAVSRELALYLAHGCQHLGGADDATPGQRRAMAARQNRWLRQAARHGLWEGLIASRRPAV